MLITIAQIALAIFQNLVPAGGVVFRGWSPSTALTLYWCENLVAAVLITIRIAVHRRLTRKRGHYRMQINTSDSGRTQTKTTFLAEFFTVSLAFTLVHGVFLAAVLAIIVKVAPDRGQVIQGLQWMVLAQILRLILDLLRIRDWPFAELKKNADSLLGRVLLIQFSIMGGMMIAALSSRPLAFFAVFGTLKTLSDIASCLPFHPKPPTTAPRWFLTMAAFLKKANIGRVDKDPAQWWRETSLGELQRIEDDEEVAPLNPA